MPRRELVGLADVVRAWRGLEATGDTRVEILRLLGFGVQTDQTPGPRHPPITSSARLSDTLGAAPAARPRPTAPLRDWLTAVPAELLAFGRSDDRRDDTPSWVQNVGTVEAPSRSELTGGPAHDTLLLPRWARSVISTVVNTEADDGPVDLERTIDLLATGETFPRVPRLPAGTLRRGAQVLVDTADGMEPFALDSGELVDELRAAIGNHRLDVHYFTGCPSRGTRPADLDGDANRDPGAGVPLVIISDLGIAQPPLSREPATVDEWSAYLDQARQRGHPLIGFVPYPRTRVPPTLARRIVVVPWDRSTTAGEAAIDRRRRARR